MMMMITMMMMNHSGYAHIAMANSNGGCFLAIQDLGRMLANSVSACAFFLFFFSLFFLFLGGDWLAPTTATI